MELIYALLISIVFNLSMFMVAFKNKTDRLTDISYALTFFALVLYAMVKDGGALFQKWILASMVLFWASRIGVYLYIRINKAGKDNRFDGMRDNFWKFGRFWFLQAITVWAVMLGPILFIEKGVKPITTFMIVGFLVWLVGLVIETTADWQKFQFSQNAKNKGKWIDSGIWKYSRHPNYFGEILVWFGVYIFVVSGLSGVDQYYAMVGPLFISFLLLFVSGIPLLEKSADAKWGKDKKYQAYKESTSILLPIPPNKK